MSRKEKMIDILERYCGNRYADREQAERKALQEIESLNLSKDKMAEVIFNSIYANKKPKQEMGAKLECLGLAQAIIKARENKGSR